jgi:catechol 2,3-dioxygenase-like lactoylglutathione lyase family enzyme
MAITHVVAGVAVADYDSARAWYERLLGRPPNMLPTENEAVWHLAETGLIYVVGDAKRAGKALLTLAVDDLEDRLAAMAGRGIATGPIETEGGGPRKAVITDPDGNMITFFAEGSSADE